MFPVKNVDVVVSQRRMIGLYNNSHISLIDYNFIILSQLFPFFGLKNFPF